MSSFAVRIPDRSCRCGICAFINTRGDRILTGSPFFFSGCPELQVLYCGGNEIKELDGSCCPELFCLFCEWNYIAELDVSNNPLLEYLSCCSKRITELDLSQNPLLYFDMLSTEGSGFVGVGYDGDPFLADCYPEEGWHFVGWYSEDGEFITDESVLFADDTEYTRIVARFEQDGLVNLVDALLILRMALGLR